jgi:Capsule assembly protein Wzi
MFRIPIILVFLFTHSFLWAQTDLKIRKEIGLGLMGSTIGENPLWARSNTWGTIPLKSNGVFFSGAINKDYDSTYNLKRKLRKVDWGFGASAFTSVGQQGRFLLPEAYLKGRWRALELKLGRWKEVHGIGSDVPGTSGGFIWSDNALPIPKIQLSISNYTSIIGKGIVSIKGNFAHGWFGKQPYTINYYLHQKMLYGKIGRESWPVTLEAGLNNQIQWGGYSETLKDNKYSSDNGYFPSGFNAFLSAAFPLPYIREKFPPNINLEYDGSNYGGNVLGTLDFGLNLKLLGSKIKIYRQLPYETGSLFTSLVNADDGIYGLSLQIPKSSLPFTHLTLEGIHTYNQGIYRAGIARILDIKDQHFGELHGYLNHGQYLEGWSNKKKGIGTPLMPPDFEVSKLKTIDTYSSFNQVKGLYLALQGNNPVGSYMIRTSFMNYRQTGGGYVPNNAEISQISFSAKYSYQFRPNAIIDMQLAYDNEGFLKRNVGLILAWRRSWY